MQYQWNKKYNYPRSTRSLINGSRYYSIDNEKLPSVSEILELTKPEKDKKSLRNWREKVGEEAARQIVTESTTRGTNMHGYLENFFLNRINGELLEKDNLAEKMANEIIENGIKDKLTEIYGVEAVLFFPQRFAGTCDLVGHYMGSDCIIDFKNSRSPKKIEWINTMFLQLSGYAMAHNKVYHTNINKGVILMCSTNLTFQKFEVEGKKFLKLQDEFMERVELFYKMTS